MSELIDTTEMYLRTVFELEEEGVPPLRARIAERLSQSGPTVSQTVARMERDGLLTVTGDRTIALSDEGRALAARVMRKHRLAERLLTDVIGIERASAHDEACRWEHVMSEPVERRLYALLGQPRFSPFGNPIPALGELGADAPGAADPVSSLADAVAGGPGSFRVARISEFAQTDSTLVLLLDRAGIEPGAVIRAAPMAGGVEVSVEGREGTCALTSDAVSHLFVVGTG